MLTIIHCIIRFSIASPLDIAVCASQTIINGSMSHIIGISMSHMSSPGTIDLVKYCLLQIRFSVSREKYFSLKEYLILPSIVSIENELKIKLCSWKIACYLLPVKFWKLCQHCLDKSHEERVRMGGARGELWMCLGRDHIGMILEFYDLGKCPIRRSR